MIRHLLLWQWTPEIRQKGGAKELAKLQAKFKTMEGRIPGTLLLECRPNLNGEVYDLALYAEFTCLEAVQAYLAHPLHLELKEMAKDWVSGRACVDIESGEVK